MLAPPTRQSRFVALDFAWRGLHCGVRGFAVFIACISRVSTAGGP